jgi:NADH-quinone oxidoreductase subunit F
MLSALRKISELPESERKVAMFSLADNVGVPYARIFSSAVFYSMFNGLPQEQRMEPVIRRRGVLLTEDKSIWQTVAIAQAAPAQVTNELSAAKLCGRGGACFPTWKKWESVRINPNDEKYVICNCSEGEPDTCKDLALLLNVPETVLAGMTVCGLAVGAAEGIIYLREGYEDAAAVLEKRIAKCGNELGGFKISIALNCGAYVCGEETALLLSLEGRRGEPRLKPPYPGDSGLYGKPTVINNAETFACVPHILLHGGECFLKDETKLFSVSGCGAKSGVYELPSKTTINEIFSVSGCCETAKAVQLGGGASGCIIPANLFGLSLERESCQKSGFSLGTGSLRFVAESESIPALCRDVIGFMRDQSCGVCTPCRFGLGKLYSLLSQAVEHGAEPEILDEIETLSSHIRDTARCALGQSAPNVLQNAVKYFRDEFCNKNNFGKGSGL